MSSGARVSVITSTSVANCAGDAPPEKAARTAGKPATKKAAPTPGEDGACGVPVEVASAHGVDADAAQAATAAQEPERHGEAGSGARSPTRAMPRRRRSTGRRREGEPQHRVDREEQRQVDPSIAARHRTLDRGHEHVAGHADAGSGATRRSTTGRASTARGARARRGRGRRRRRRSPGCDATARPSPRWTPPSPPRRRAPSPAARRTARSP